jgi:1,4-dihydroxy-2-naphthoyl-CoA hydrolase
MSDSPFEYLFTVALHDTDAAGTMFFAHLFRHAHDAYEGFMGVIGFPLDRMIRQGTRHLPLVHAEADYRRPLRHGDLARVLLRPAKVGHSSFMLEYQFIDQQGESCAHARTTHVNIGPDGSKAAPLPDELRAALTARLAPQARGDLGP